jgi:hypothetical protein
VQGSRPLKPTVGRTSNKETWRLASIAGLIYLLIAALLLARGLLGHPGYYIGQDTDPPVHMWFFNWWRFALSHGLNPFFTDWVWAPLGVNLAWTTFMPLLSILSIPLQLTLGEPATYNMMLTLMLPLAAFSAFLLCRRVTHAFWPSVVGGYLFGFSPYMLGQVLAHPGLVSVFPIPLIALLTLKRLDSEISARRFAILLAALLTILFLSFPELFTTVTMMSGFSLILALALFGEDLRPRLIGLITPVIAAYAIVAAVLSPYLYFMLARGYPHSPVFKTGNYSADLLAFLVPTETVVLGTARAATKITDTFQGDLYENGAYLGLALILFVEIFRRRYWREPVGKFLTILFIVPVIAALGPTLHIAGQPGLPMPWALIGRLPILSIALPVRFMMYAFLAIAVMLAMWLAAPSSRPLPKWIAAAVIVASVAPNPRASFWVSPLDIPAFFSDRTYATELQPREIILPLPWGQRGNSMYWQLQSDMYFRMAGGYVGQFVPFEFSRMPVANYFYGGIDLPEAGEQLKAYVARFGVEAVVADPRQANFPSFKQTLDSLRVAEIQEKGNVLIYKIPPDSFAAYARLPAARVEARADALRFDAILEAAGKYLAGGHDLSKISALELKRLDLLPPDWQVNPPPGYTDWQIGPATGGGVGIITVGSYEGVRPLLERYRQIASELDYPAPTRWAPDSPPRTDFVAPMLVTFEPARLAAAAQQLHDSPPPERTTPFLAGVLAGLGSNP